MRPKRLRDLISIAAALAGLTACLPTNNFATPSTGSAQSSSSGAGAGLGSSASGDNAQPPCTLYDPSAPTRSICVNCYQSILATRCPHKSSFAQCIDPDVQKNYVSLVNQCVSQSTQAGFVCTTTCSNGMVINPQSCTCVMPTVSSAGNISNTDVGQKDFGPPIVKATFPPSSLIGTPSPSPDPTAAPPVVPSSCIGQIPLYFGVQNRGDTIFRLNQYSDAVITSSNNKEPVPVPYLSGTGQPGATRPRMLDTTETAAIPGANAVSLLNFRTGGKSEVTAATGGRISNITTVSSTTSDGTGATGDNGAASAATWQTPAFGTRDKDGNVYFSDAGANTVRVICYQPEAMGQPGICNGQNVGAILPVAGQEGVAGPASAIGATVAATGATLNAPHGVAVDSNYNVYIADSGNHVIRVVCESVLGVCSPAGLANVVTGLVPAKGNIYTIAGTPNTPGPPSNNATLNYPYGLDVEESGNNINMAIADFQNHAIRKLCQFAAVATSYCGATTANALATHLGNGIGNGTSGYRADTDGAVISTNAWAKNPTDVKIDWDFNVIYADYGNHQVRAICTNKIGTGVCKGSQTTVLTLAGTGKTSGVQPLPGDQGSGTLGTSTQLTFPTQILLAKQYGGDVAALASPNTAFRDNNVVFTESPLFGSALGSIVALPTQVPGVTSVQSIAMSTASTCFLSTTGTVACVGSNLAGQLGNGTVGGSSSTPTAVIGLGANPSQISSGVDHVCAVSTTGNSVKCWGNDSYHQLADNTTNSTGTPVAAPLPKSGETIQPGQQLGLGDRHTCAIINDTANTGSITVFCAGDNAYGQLGTNDNTPHGTLTAVDNTVPMAFNGGNPVNYSNLVAGSNHTCAWESTSGHLYCWGAGGLGQLGQGATTDSVQSVAVSGWVTAPVALAAGGNHTCGIDTVNNVYCWGSNSYGEVGNGSLSDSQSTPALVQGISNATQIAVGLNHSCAIANNIVKCWGSNLEGQVGNGNASKVPFAVDVIGLPSGVPTGIYAGGNQTCATFGGIPYCWGDNSNFALSQGASGQTPSGNVLNIICGNNSAMPSFGLCSGVSVTAPAAGKSPTYPVFRIAGTPGKFGNRGQGDGHDARSALFAGLYGVTYDAYKNLIVSSGGFTDSQNNAHSDYSLRLIYDTVVGPKSSAKYTVTDSNGQSSYWCLRLKPLTSCDSSGNCFCSLSPPTDDADPNFWEAVSQSQDCP